MMHYRMANEGDREAIIDFINLVFSMVRVPHDFEALLPKVYAPVRSALTGIHMLAEDDAGRICGCLGMLTYPLRVAGQTLNVGYLGSMAVHPRARGKGIMGELVRRQAERAKEMGLDLLALGGQRQRYGYGGFETGGTAHLYSLSQANVRHALAEVDASQVVLRDARQEDAAQMLALYDAQIVAGARSEADFLAILRSYSHRAVTIERGGQPVGYLSLSGDGQEVSELVVQEPELILPSLKRWAQGQSARMLHVAAAPQDVTLNRLLAPICESDAISPCCMLRVLRPERVLGAYMRLKNALSPLPEGQLVLGWEGLGAYRLTVENGRAEAEPTDAAPDIALSGLAMHRLLFAHNRFAAPVVDHPLAERWFPLPVHIPEPDSF